MKTLAALLALVSTTCASNPGQAVVRIQRGDGRLLASGVVISSELVLTVKHVVEGGFNHDYVIRFQDGKQVTGRPLAQAVAYDGPALIKIPKGVYPIAEIASRSAQAGRDKIWGLGYPSGTPKLTYMVGRVRAGHQIGNAHTVEFDQGQIPGYSGGPLFNRHGQIIGLASHTDFSHTWHITLPTIAAFCYKYGVRPGVLYGDNGRPFLPPPALQSP